MSSIDWDKARLESFVFLGHEFDVSLAKQILANKRRVRVTEIDVSEAQNMIVPRGAVMMGVLVDWDVVRSDVVDITVPIIVVQLKKGSLLPIDGWHRIAKAQLLGLAKLPACILSKQDSKRVQCGY